MMISNSVDLKHKQNDEDEQIDIPSHKHILQDDESEGSDFLDNELRMKEQPYKKDNADNTEK